MSTVSDTHRIPDVQLWLHPMHGGTQSGFMPWQHARLQDAKQEPERLSALEEAARLVPLAAHQQQPSEQIEVQVAETGLFVLDSFAERRLWLPLILAQVVSVPMMNGVAYSLPIRKELLCWGDGRDALRGATHSGSGDVWVLLVTRRGEHGSPVAGDGAVVRKVLEAFGKRGAIRGSLDGLELAESMGTGSFGSVRLLQPLMQSQMSRCNSLTSTRPAVSELRTHHVVSAGFATAWPAIESTCDLQPALAGKIVANAAYRENILSEAMYLLAAQGHINVVRFVSLFCTSLSGQPRWVLATEAHPCGDVHAKVATLGQLSERDSLGIGEDVCSALSHIHALGVIHRDVKPANIVLAANGQAILIDFGIAVHESEIQKITVRSGSIDYFAPERMHVADNYGAKVDVYSCGMALCFCLVGVSAFHDLVSDRSVDKCVLALEMLSERNCEQHVCEAVLGMSSANPEDRPTSNEATEQLKNARKHCRTDEVRTRNLAESLLVARSVPTGCNTAVGHNAKGISLPGAMCAEAGKLSPELQSVVPGAFSPSASTKLPSKGSSMLSGGEDIFLDGGSCPSAPSAPEARSYLGVPSGEKMQERDQTPGVPAGRRPSVMRRLTSLQSWRTAFQSAKHIFFFSHQNNNVSRAD